MSEQLKICENDDEDLKDLLQLNISSDDSGIEDGPDSLPSSVEDEKHENEVQIKIKKDQQGNRLRSKTFSLFGRLFNKKKTNFDNKTRKSQTLPVTAKEFNKPKNIGNQLCVVDQDKNENINKNENKSLADNVKNENEAFLDVQKDENEAFLDVQKDENEALNGVSENSVGKNTIFKNVGKTGLDNVDNSCYMNSVLQCLTHIDLFAQYFCRDLYKKDCTFCDTEKHNVTSSLSKLFKTLWLPNENYAPDLYTDFLKTVGKNNKDFSHGEQQDAQEFFMWLIDKLHVESMDNTQEKKTKSLQKKKGRSDAEQAVLAFASYTHFYQSYIQSLFISQYRSSIKCAYCSNYSNTYDPYLCISLSIPPRARLIVFLSVIFENESPVKLALTLNRDEKVSSIRNIIKEKFPQLEHYTMIRMKTDGTFTYVDENKHVTSLPFTENSFHIIEFSKDYIENRNVVKTKNDVNAEQFIHLVVSNVEIFHKQRLRFGGVRSINVSYDLPFKDLQSILVSRMPPRERTIVSKTVRHHPYSMRWRLINKDERPGDEVDYMITSCEYPLHDHTTYRNIFEHENFRCLYVLVEWEAIEPAWRFRKIEVPKPLEESSCEEARMTKKEKHIVTLNDCLQLQTQEEELPSDVSWRCEFCRKKQEGLTKKLSLWSLPDVLVFHLKRFDQFHGNDGKITTVVEYPIEGLNMFQYLAGSGNSRLKKTIKKASIRLNYQPPPENEEDCIYDLKGVCNHLGRFVNTGHYTAHCKNSFDNQWYTFDDRYVTKIERNNDVISSNAYLLFYQRRNVSDVVKSKLNDVLTSVSPDRHWSSLTDAQEEEKVTDDVAESKARSDFELDL